MRWIAVYLYIGIATVVGTYLTDYIVGADFGELSLREHLRMIVLMFCAWPLVCWWFFQEGSE